MGHDVSKCMKGMWDFFLMWLSIYTHVRTHKWSGTLWTNDAWSWYFLKANFERFLFLPSKLIKLHCALFVWGNLVRLLYIEEEGVSQQKGMLDFQIYLQLISSISLMFVLICKLKSNHAITRRDMISQVHKK